MNQLRNVSYCSLGNLILTDLEGRIISCAKQISEKITKMNAIQAGSQYEFPLPAKGFTPSPTEDFKEWRENMQNTFYEVGEFGYAAEEKLSTGDKLLVAAYRVRLDILVHLLQAKVFT